MLTWFAARAAGVWTSTRLEDRDAQLAALQNEEYAALQALAREWTARRQAAFAAAKTDVTSRRPRLEPYRPALRRFRVRRSKRLD